MLEHKYCIEFREHLQPEFWFAARYGYNTAGLKHLEIDSNSFGKQ